jgi:hypothetical protein
VESESFITANKAFFQNYRSLFFSPRKITPARQFKNHRRPKLN